MKYWNIELDGPDKTGKTLLAKYITQLSGYKYATHDRGYMTQVAYAKKFHRPFTYAAPNKNTVYILLTCNKEEHDIRCKISNEPKIDFDTDMRIFEEVFVKLLKQGYHTLMYNTSDHSMLHIAKDIIMQIDELEEKSK